MLRAPDPRDRFNYRHEIGVVGKHDRDMALIGRDPFHGRESELYVDALFDRRLGPIVGISQRTVTDFDDPRGRRGDPHGRLLAIGRVPDRISI